MSSIFIIPEEQEAIADLLKNIVDVLEWNEANMRYEAQKGLWFCASVEQMQTIEGIARKVKGASK